MGYAEAVSSAQRFLDQVHSLAHIDELEREPGRFAEVLTAELPDQATSFASIEARDALLASSLSAIDAACVRWMRVRLDHALAMDSSLAQATRNVFASTIVSYADKLSLLAQRARDVAARGGAGHPDDVADKVVEAARSVLAVREAVRAGVLAVIRDVLTPAIPEADRCARDRDLDEKVRRRWSAVRRDFEIIAAGPEQITIAPLATRITSLPDQLDEPAAEPERSFADLIEMD